jgi:hypothetical protein
LTEGFGAAALTLGQEVVADAMLQHWNSPPVLLAGCRAVRVLSQTASHMTSALLQLGAISFDEVVLINALQILKCCGGCGSAQVADGF